MLITLGTCKINRPLRGTFQHKNIFRPRFSAIPLLSFLCLFGQKLCTSHFLWSFFLFVIGSIFQHDMCMLT